jgi:hypothetical protein
MGQVQEKLTALAERAISADPQDCGLEAEIAVALNIGARGVTSDDHEYLSLPRADDGCAAGTYWFHCRSGKSLRTAPRFLGSTDAALSLKDTDWLLDVEQTFDLGWEVELWVIENKAASEASRVKGASLPGLLTASSLMVRATLAAPVSA